MQLATLKKLLRQLQERIAEDTSGKSAQELALATENLFLYLVDSPAESQLTSSTSPFKLAQKKYFQILGALEETAQHVENYITELENEGVTDEEEVEDVFPTGYVANYNGLAPHYMSLLQEINKFYLNNREPGTLFLGTENFTTPADLQFILEVTSGKFDLAKCNARLKQSKHAELEGENAVNKGFYIDHDGSSFVGQSVKEVGRSTEPSIILKKCEDFVDLYLKNTQLPAEIKPNLMALVSTLAYQSGIQGITHLELLKTLYGTFTELDPPIASIAAGNADKLYFWFDADKNLCIQGLGKIAPVIFSNGGFVPGESKGNIVKSTNIIIKVTCNANKEPTFTLDTFEQTISCFLDKSHAETMEWGVKRRNLSVNNTVDKKHFSILEDMFENLVKFAGYASIKDWSEGDPHTKKNEAICLFAPSFYLYELNKSSENPIGLNQGELQLINQLYDGFYKAHVPPEALAKHIANFVVNALPKLSAQDKIRYIYLLKMAAYFGGPDLKEVNTAFSTLLSNVAADEPTLLAALKTDIHLYNLYQAKTSEWFSGLPKFSPNEHQSILKALSHELPDFVAKHPAFIKKNDGVLDVLNNLSLEEKIKFLHSVKDPIETLGANFIVLVVSELYSLCEDTKLSEVAAHNAENGIAYCAEMLARKKSDRRIRKEDQKQIELCFDALTEAYQFLSKQKERIEAKKIETAKSLLSAKTPDLSSEIHIKQIPGTEETSEEGSEERIATSEISTKSSSQKKEGSPVEKGIVEFEQLFSKVKEKEKELLTKIESDTSSEEHKEKSEEEQVTKKTNTPGTK